MSRVKEKQYHFGKAYRWRLIKFESCGLKCRILLLLNLEKEIFRARLGVDDSGDTIVLCDHEFHASEPGWHCHFTLDDIDLAVPGAARSGKRRWPRGQNQAAKFTVTEAGALTIAAKRFGLVEEGPLG